MAAIRFKLNQIGDGSRLKALSTQSLFRNFSRISFRYIQVHRVHVSFLVQVTLAYVLFDVHHFYGATLTLYNPRYNPSAS